MRHARLIEAGAGEYWMWMSNVCYGPAGYRAPSVAEAAGGKSSRVGRTVGGQRAQERPKVPSKPGCRLLGLPAFLRALVSWGGAGGGAEVVAGADLSVFVTDAFAARVGQREQSPGWDSVEKAERAGGMSQIRSEVH